MGTITLTLPVAGTNVAAGLHATNYSLLQAVINGGLDNANFAASAAIQASKIKARGAFSANAPGTQIVGNGSIAKVILSSEEFDPDGWYDVQTSRFTPQVAGYYAFHGLAAWTTAMAAGDRLQVILYKNGSPYRYFSIIYASNTGDAYYHGGSAMAVANGTTDYFELYVVNNAANNRNLGGSSFLQGYLIGVN